MVPKSGDVKSVHYITYFKIVEYIAWNDEIKNEK